MDKKISLGDSIVFFKSVLFRRRTEGADAYLDEFGDFDVEKLRFLTRKKLSAILLDVDGCIAPPCDNIYGKNLDKIKELCGQDMKIGIYSNCRDLPRLDPLKAMDIRIYDGNEPKPGYRGFLNACAFFGFDPKETWMVGDNPLTDGGAIGVLNGMAFVKPIPENWRSLPKYQVTPFYFRKLFRYLAMKTTLRINPGIITTETLRHL